METHVAESTTAEQLSSEKPLLTPVKGKEGQNRKLRDTKLSFEAEQTKATVAMQQKYKESPNPTEMYWDSRRYYEELMHSKHKIHTLQSELRQIEMVVQSELWGKEVEIIMLQSELRRTKMKVEMLQSKLWRIKREEKMLEDWHHPKQRREMLIDAFEKNVAEIENTIQQLQEKEMQIFQISDTLEKNIAEIENKIQQLHVQAHVGSLPPQTYGESTPSIDLGAHSKNKIQQLHVQAYIGSLLPQTYGESTSSIDLGAHSKSDDQH